MTPTETKQAAAVMIASETKNIQERYRHGKSDDGWVDCPEPDWDWDSCEFRIAPEPMDFEWATNALKHIRDIVGEKDANGEDIEIGSTAMKSILRWASGELKEPRQPEPLEVEVWVHEDGTIVGPANDNHDFMKSQGHTLRRATIHPETK
jgi:hypothetical protein